MAVDTRVSFTMKDGDGVEASTFLYALATDAATAAEIEADAQHLCLALDKVTDDMITEVRATIFPTLPPTGVLATNIKAAPNVPSMTERTGLFTFAGTLSPKLWSFDTPGLSFSTTIVNSGKIVLTGGSLAQALANAITAGGTVLSYTNADTQPVTTLSRTRWGTHKHRKQRQRGSQT